MDRQLLLQRGWPARISDRQALGSRVAECGEGTTGRDACATGSRVAEYEEKEGLGCRVANCEEKPVLAGARGRRGMVSSRLKLRRTCQEFESVFVAYLLRSMRRTVPHEPSSTHGWESRLSEDTYLSMMDQEIAAHIARGPGIGLAEILYRQLISSYSNPGSQNSTDGDPRTRRTGKSYLAGGS